VAVVEEGVEVEQEEAQEVALHALRQDLLLDLLLGLPQDLLILQDDKTLTAPLL
jgi:hypothetical protein